MDIVLIKKLVKLVEESNVSSLELEEKDLKIKVTKEMHSVAVNVPAYVQNVPVSAPATNAAAVSTALPAVQAAGAPVTEPAKNNYHEIKSPIVGTFYRASSPDADPFVKVGDTVTVGQVLCIIEAMKLMNEIESDVSGKVVEVLLENGKPVEYGQPLFRVEA
ncbi:MAG: acetyl-CoA carboxylase biotin carboxyl carrier protein [Ignavibacteria bacterium]|nr:acetyl-CoA carboxylase biotin carboxyl carrier protein [Ignavibacteria bacterium]